MSGSAIGRRAVIGGAALAAAFGAAADAQPGRAAPRFPLRIAQGGRYLEDSAGQPFLLHGDTAWSLIAQLNPEEAELYLRDRQSRGFNTLLVNLIEHRYASRAPANIRGDAPFTRANDFTAPNEAYFAYADRMLRRARDLGFLVLLAPAYIGGDGGEDGWYQPMLAAGNAALRRYGAYVGRRYRAFDNILWVHAGDYNPPDRSVVLAVAEEIAAADPGALHTAHCAPETAPADFFRGAAWLNVNNVYTYRPVDPMARRQEQRRDRMPFIMIESAYENEHHASEQRIRSQAYQALLNGACGHVFGNSPIWHYGTSPIHPRPMRWQAALGSRGAQSMTQLRRIMEELPWTTLQPDTEERFLIGPRGEGHERSVAAVARDGSCAVAYVAGGHSATVDLSALRSGDVAVRWIDPSAGNVLIAPEVEPARGHRWRLTSPGANASGFADWVLEVRVRGS